MNWKWVFLGICVVLVSIIALGFAFLFSSSSTLPLNYVQEVNVAESQEEILALPVKLLIPSIDVEASVQHVGLDPKSPGDMAVPTNFTDVGWYKYGVRPGMQGSAVIAGHFNGKEVAEAVFYDLDALQVGDEVMVVSEDEIKYIFEVVKIETYSYDEPTLDVFVSNDGKKRLNLITCGGEWLSGVNRYDERTVIFTELVTNSE